MTAQEIKPCVYDEDGCQTHPGGSASWCDKATDPEVEKLSLALAKAELRADKLEARVTASEETEREDSK